MFLADVEAMLADYNDLGMVEIWHDDSQDIFKILDVENASIDKLMYTVSKPLVHRGLVGGARPLILVWMLYL